ncbi:monodechloroaminopyrrolnitrin synthase PrnB family protein [Cystobacter fuscus]|uniref:monodechloroaminopyrrolnitrin synthase PrnB family protein n=1 Tax=Cystobacter fuscus TaxID=43 RepID=UPI002B30860A|nr:DUF1864 family protein [Cystobacter fuscus]
MSFDHTAIAPLDPLEASALLCQLPSLNRAANVEGLVHLLRGLSEKASRLQGGDPARAAAVMRDLGMCLGSLKHHGHEPLELVPQLEPVLRRLGERTGLPPRDTLLHYSVWNPPGDRLRTYTGLPDEVQLIQSVRLAIPPLESAITRLAELYEVPVRAPDFVPLCTQVLEGLRQLVESIVHAHRHVSPHVFASELRSYYDPILIGGTPYLGPGAVEMPLFVLEHLLWGSSSTEAGYVAFKERYVPYILPEWRALYRRHVGRPSLVDRVLEEVHALEEPNDTARAGVDALRALVGMLIRFRAPHLKLAEKSYSAESGNPRGVGSGGFTVEMLAELLRLTREAQARLVLPVLPGLPGHQPGAGR